MLLECNISRDDLKIVLLKCVGSRYPTRIVCSNEEEKSVFIRGFEDADCNVLLLSDTEANRPSPLAISNIKRVETMKVISYDRARSRIFNVN